jgi:energy-coupling factor transport system permease protein
MKIFKRLDVRTKIIIVLCLSTPAVIIQDPYILTLLFVVSILLSLFTGSNLKMVFKKLSNIWYIFLILVLLQSIFVKSGQKLLSIGGLTILTAGGIIKGVEFILRLMIIIISATIMTTSNHKEIIQGLNQFKIPYEISFMVSVAIRFLPMLSSEIKNTLTAIQLRGIEIEKLKFFKRIRLYRYIFYPILINTVKKAHMLSIAMEARAFRAYPCRTSYLFLKFRAIDYIIIPVSLLLTVSIIFYYYFLN